MYKLPKQKNFRYLESGFNLSLVIALGGVGLCFFGDTVTISYTSDLFNNTPSISDIIFGSGLNTHIPNITKCSLKIVTADSLVNSMSNLHNVSTLDYNSDIISKIGKRPFLYNPINLHSLPYLLPIP